MNTQFLEFVSQSLFCLEPGFSPSLHKVYYSVGQHLLTVQLLCNFLEPLLSKEVLQSLASTSFFRCLDLGVFSSSQKLSAYTRCQDVTGLLDVTSNPSRLIGPGSTVFTVSPHQWQRCYVDGVPRWCTVVYLLRWSASSRQIRSKHAIRTTKPRKRASYSIRLSFRVLSPWNSIDISSGYGGSP